MVTVKTAPDWPLKNELAVLEAVRDNPYIRPIIDSSDNPPSLILKHLDDNLLNASNARKLDRVEVKYVARNILQALDGLHSRGYVHTGIVQHHPNVLISHIHTDRQTSSLITFLSTMALHRTASQKYSSVIVETPL